MNDGGGIVIQTRQCLDCGRDFRAPHYSPATRCLPCDNYRAEVESDRVKAHQMPADWTAAITADPFLGLDRGVIPGAGPVIGPLAAAVVFVGFILPAILVLNDRVRRARASWRLRHRDSMDIELEAMAMEVGQTFALGVAAFAEIHPDRCPCGWAGSFDDVVVTDLSRIYFYGTDLVHRCSRPEGWC